MKQWMFILAMAMVATRLPAPEPPPVALPLVITRGAPGTITISGNGGSANAETHLLMTTNLTSPHWTAIATNFESGTDTLVYTNVPVTVTPVFFEVEVFPL